MQVKCLQNPSAPAGVSKNSTQTGQSAVLQLLHQFIACNDIVIPKLGMVYSICRYIKVLEYIQKFTFFPCYCQV